MLLEDGSREYEVERIVGERRRGRRVEYLVKWKGFGEFENSWEPSYNLENASERVKDWQE